MKTSYNKTEIQSCTVKRIMWHDLRTIAIISAHLTVGCVQHNAFNTSANHIDYDMSRYP